MKSAAVYFLVAGAILFCLDQWSKRLVELYVADRCLTWSRVVRFRLVRNERRIYGQRGVRVALVLAWFVALASAALLYEGGRAFRARFAVIALGVAFGGAAGNLAGILRRASIPDFIDLGWWPVFNLADVAIVGGLVLA